MLGVCTLKVHKKDTFLICYTASLLLKTKIKESLYKSNQIRNQRLNYILPTQELPI